MITAILVYFLAHIGAITAAPSTVNIVAGGAIVETTAAALDNAKISADASW